VILGTCSHHANGSSGLRITVLVTLILGGTVVELQREKYDPQKQ